MPKTKQLALRAKKRFDHLWDRQQTSWRKEKPKKDNAEKKQRAAWYESIALARREQNVEIIQDVPRYSWITQHDETKRLQAIKEILANGFPTPGFPQTPLPPTSGTPE